MKNPNCQKECKKGILRLYSAEKFKDSADRQTIGKIRSGEEISFKIKFISSYKTVKGPTIYFNAIVSLTTVPTISGTYIKKHISVKDICFKNEVNVSRSSQTKEYGYLYDISCSSADNSNSCSSDSSSCSLSSIINKGIEKQIASLIVEFFSGPYFTVVAEKHFGFVILNVNPGSVPVIFPAAKAICKFVGLSSSSCNKSSSCSSSSSSHSSSSYFSSSSSCNKSNWIVKMLIIAGIVLLVVSLLCRNNCSDLDAKGVGAMVKSSIGGVVNSFKNLLGLGYSSASTSASTPTPDSNPENNNANQEHNYANQEYTYVQQGAKDNVV